MGGDVPKTGTDGTATVNALGPGAYELTATLGPRTATRIGDGPRGQRSGHDGHVARTRDRSLQCAATPEGAADRTHRLR